MFVCISICGILYKVDADADSHVHESLTTSNESEEDDPTVILSPL